MLNGRVHIKQISSIVENVAIFLWHANLSVNAACSSSLRDLFVVSFDEGWKARDTPKSPKMADMSWRLIPKLTPPLLKAALSKVTTFLKCYHLFEVLPLGVP